MSFKGLNCAGDHTWSSICIPINNISSQASTLALNWHFLWVVGPTTHKTQKTRSRALSAGQSHHMGLYAHICTSKCAVGGATTAAYCVCVCVCVNSEHRRSVGYCGSHQYSSTNAKLCESERAVCTPGPTEALKNMMTRPASMHQEFSHCATVDVACPSLII